VLFPPGHEGEEREILRAVGQGEVLRFDAQRRCKDGRDIAVSVTCSPVRDAAGRVIGIAKVARDITDRREAEAALMIAKDAAEAANRELETFSYSVAHDLRAPLRGMNGFAQILLEDYRDKLDAEGLDCLHEIHTNANRMGELIDSLLSLSRTTRADLKPVALDLSELVRNIVTELQATTPERAVHVTVQDELRVCMDPALTRVLFDNLLGNAWKFTANVAEARIEVGCIVRDGGRSLFVRDNGAGFAMAHASKLFSPFQRLHTTAEFAGTGIGLATVQRIARRHGAHVWAEGKVGEGAVFYLGLPATSWDSPGPASRVT
jgi:light-regulated signal transduction histidine kinase (bacteriophytochrome)